MILSLLHVTIDKFYSTLYEYNEADTSLASRLRQTRIRHVTAAEPYTTGTFDRTMSKHLNHFSLTFLSLVLILLPRGPEELIKRPLAARTSTATTSSTGSTLITLQDPSKGTVVSVSVLS